MNLVIMSHKRADCVDTLKVVSACSLSVSASQEAEYKKNYPNAHYIVHPDSVIGLPAKINWLIKELGQVILLDDDISSVKRTYVDSEFEEGNNVKDPDMVYDIIMQSAQVSKDMGAKLFGFATSAKPVCYTSFRPFKLSGFVIGGCFGILDGRNMEIPKEITSATDYYLSGVNAFYNRRAFINTRYAFCSKGGTFKSNGGTMDQRSLDTERSDYIFLKQNFGDAISKKRDNPVKNIQHNYERVFSVDF